MQKSCRAVCVWGLTDRPVSESSSTGFLGEAFMLRPDAAGLGAALGLALAARSNEQTRQRGTKQAHECLFGCRSVCVNYSFLVTLQVFF